MNGSLVKKILVTGQWYWTYKHPTVADAFAELIADDSELLEIYVTGANPARLVAEVVCGDVSIEGARVVVPERLFSKLISALDQVTERERLRFLASRCDVRFLSTYVTARPNFQDSLVELNHSSRAFSPKILAAAKLRHSGLLEEDILQRLLAEITEIAIKHFDPDFQNPKYIGNFLTPDETQEILTGVRDSIVPEALDHVRRFNRNYDPNDEPGEYFAPLLQTLEMLQDHFGEDEEVTALIEAALSDAYNALEDAKEAYRERPEDSETPELYGDLETPSASEDADGEAERSIFDDVDA